MAEVASAFVTLMPSARGFGKATDKEITPGLEQTGKKAGSRFGAAIGRAAKVGAAIGGVALVGFAKKAIGASSEAQQSIGATETVFGRFANTVIKTSKGAAQQYGLSANEYRENANLIGSLFKNQGVASDQLAGKTQKMIGVGADLAATFGGTTKEAVEALGSAFKGEFNPMERYGVSLRQSTINSEAFRVAGVKSEAQFKRLSVEQQNAAKQQATTNLIMKQTADAQGQFGRESNTLAGQQQRLGASFENLTVTLGNRLLPVATRVVEWVAKFVAGMQNGTGAGGRFAAVASSVGSAMASLAGFIKRNSDVIVPLVAGLGAAAAVMKVISVATKVWAAAQILLNVALTANPIGLVIAAIAALVVGLVVAYKKSETFRNVVNKVWAAVKVGAAIMWGAIKGYFKLWMAGFKAVGAVGKWLWNNALQPVFKFIVKGVGNLMVMWGKMLRALGKVPGFGWAKKAGDVMVGAGRKAIGLANDIKKIPNSKNVRVSANTAAARQQIANVEGAMARLRANPEVLLRIRAVRSGAGLGVAGARAHGGPVTGGKTYLVGERGPELFTASQSGRIIPNNKLGSATRTAGGVTQNIYTSDPIRAAREANRQLAWAGAV